MARLRTFPSQIEARQLRALVALAEHGTVSAAARTLGLAQSTVSEGLAVLERLAGTSLVVRARGGHAVTLTSAGRALLPHARTVIAAVDRAASALSEVSKNARAVVDIVANESVTTYVLPGALSRLRTRWPNTRFAVSMGTCDEVRRAVEAGRCDVGVLLVRAGRRTSVRSRNGGKPPVRFAERRELALQVPLAIFGLPSHPLIPKNGSGSVSRDALAPFSLLVSDAEGDFFALVDRLFHTAGAGPRLEPTGSVEAVKRGVLADAYALGLLPGYAVADELRTRRLVRLVVRPPLPRMELEALLSRRRTQHPIATELIDELRRTAAAP